MRDCVRPHSTKGQRNARCMRTEASNRKTNEMTDNMKTGAYMKCWEGRGGGGGTVQKQSNRVPVRRCMENAKAMRASKGGMQGRAWWVYDSCSECKLRCERNGTRHEVPMKEMMQQQEPHREKRATEYDTFYFYSCTSRREQKKKELCKHKCSTYDAKTNA